MMTTHLIDATALTNALLGDGSVSQPRGKDRLPRRRAFAMADGAET